MEERQVKEHLPAAVRWPRVVALAPSAPQDRGVAPPLKWTTVGAFSDGNNNAMPRAEHKPH